MIPDMILRIGLHVSDLLLTVFSLHSVLRIVFVEFNMWVDPIIVNGPSTMYLFFLLTILQQHLAYLRPQLTYNLV